MKDDKCKDAEMFFRECGFKVIYVVAEEFYILRPLDKTESEIYGSAALSQRAMEAISLKVKAK